jgi:hypothetical protein
MRKPLVKYDSVPKAISYFFNSVSIPPPHSKKGYFIESSVFSYSNFVENALLNEAINFRRRG